MAYNVLYPVHIIVATSMTASITSAVVETRNQDNIGFQLNWTGAPVGTFTFQVSMDFFEDINGNIVNPGNWTTLPVTPAITAAGTPNTAYVDINQTSSPYMRVVYTFASGTGTLDGFANGKGI